MSVLRLPVRSDIQSYKYRVTLDGVSYNLRFRFNARYNKWIMDILTFDDVPISLGRPVLTNIDPFLRFIDPRLPAGNMIAGDLSNKDLDADGDTFGVTVVLFYEEAA